MAAKPKKVRPPKREAEESQVKRFEKAAQELGAEYDEAALGRALVKVARGGARDAETVRTPRSNKSTPPKAGS